MGLVACSNALSTHLPLPAENEANDAFDLLEPSRIEREGYFNPAIRRPVDVEHEPRGGKLHQVEPEVPGIAVRLVRLYVANAAIIVLELALQEEVGFIDADKSRSAPGSSPWNETWKYWPSKSPTDTYVAWSFNGLPSVSLV